MYDPQFIAASVIIDKYYPTIKECMFKLAEINFQGEIQRHTEVGSITFKIE